MWSGGITSWATARIVIDRHGRENTTLLFADTNYEDPDLHRWNADAVVSLGMDLVRVADAQERNPWDVFRDKKYIGNTRIAPCSHLLKQVPCREWLAENCDPANTIVYVGIDWDETHRIPAIAAGYAHTIKGCASRKHCLDLFGPGGRRQGPGCRNLLPLAWTSVAPLTEPPFQDKDFWIAEAERAGLRPPRLYGLGFPHNNCGGACIKAGQAQWKRVLEVFPERYADAEASEEAMRADLGKDVAFLRDRRGGETKPLPLKLLRTRLEADAEAMPGLFDADDWGGCGCFTETDEMPEIT
jgi:3'-phosphoadenosine 5'-phosphosulfate sulfotransferase (PAPS reductase)/FAD synthetase